MLRPTLNKKGNPSHMGNRVAHVVKPIGIREFSIQWVKTYFPREKAIRGDSERKRKQKLVSIAANLQMTHLPMCKRYLYDTLAMR